VVSCSVRHIRHNHSDHQQRRRCVLAPPAGSRPATSVLERTLRMGRLADQRCDITDLDLVIQNKFLTLTIQMVWHLPGAVDATLAGRGQVTTWCT
jgi:hypothetical protein